MRAPPGAVPLLEHDERVALVHRLTLLAQDLPDHPRVLRLDRHLHLHRLEDDHRVALGDRLADLALDLPHGARDVGLDLRHAVLLRDISSVGKPAWTITAGVDGGPAGRRGYAAAVTPEPLPEQKAPDDLTPIRAQVYKDPRPPEYFERFHARARSREPDAMYEIVRTITSLYGWIAFRTRGVAPEHVPPSGPVILAPNHFSFLDHFFLGASIRRKVRFMAKSQLFTRPMQFVYSHGGVFPVRRGHRDEEAFVTAAAILERGGCLAMYCEGGRSRTGRIGDRARPGIGRLALESGAPVVPVAIHGSSRVRNWKRLQFPKVTVLYGEPFRYERVAEPTRNQQQAVADDILETIRELYGRLETEGREAAVARWRAERRAKRTVPAS